MGCMFVFSSGSDLIDIRPTKKVELQSSNRRLINAWFTMVQRSFKGCMNVLNSFLRLHSMQSYSLTFFSFYFYFRIHHAFRSRHTVSAEIHYNHELYQLRWVSPRLFNNLIFKVDIIVGYFVDTPVMSAPYIHVPKTWCKPAGRDCGDLSVWRTFHWLCSP